MYAVKFGRSLVHLTFGLFLVSGLSGCSFGVSARLLGATSVSTSPSIAPTPTPTPAPLTYLRGINIMDLGISGTVIPGVYGTNYTKPSLTALQQLKARGLNVVRIPFLWERIQPTLGGALDTTYLGYLIQVLKDANTAGLKVIIDMHNYAGYNISGTIHHFNSDSGPTTAQYADAWTKISAAIQAEPLAAAAVYSYDIMNEPANIYDSRNTVPTTGAFVVSNFATTDEGWLPRDNTNTVVAWDAHNSGSLKVTMTAPAGGTQVLGAVLNNNVQQTAIANGPTFRVRGYVPVTTPGNNARVRFLMYDSSYVGHFSSTFNITKGETFEFHHTPTAGNFPGNVQISVELIVDGTSAADQIVFYLDDVVQGTPITGVSPQAAWETYSQAAVTAIRAANDNTLLSIQGYAYSSAKDWATNHPTKWITDSANNHMYDAHLYFDDDGSGTYSNTFATETTNATGQGYASVSARTVARVKVFTDWVTAQNTKGFIGEYGWPNSDVAGASDAASWNTVGDDLLTHLDSVNMGATMWATGSWLSPTDNKLNAYVLGTFQALSQSTILENHLGK